MSTRVKAHYREVKGKLIRVKEHLRRTPGSYGVARIKKRKR